MIKSKRVARYLLKRTVSIKYNTRRCNAPTIGKTQNRSSISDKFDWLITYSSPYFCLITEKLRI